LFRNPVLLSGDCLLHYERGAAFIDDYTVIEKPGFVLSAFLRSEAGPDFGAIVGTWLSWGMRGINDHSLLDDYLSPDCPLSSLCDSGFVRVLFSPDLSPGLLPVIALRLMSTAGS